MIRLNCVTGCLRIFHIKKEGSEDPPSLAHQTQKEYLMPSLPPTFRSEVEKLVSAVRADSSP